MDIQTAVLWTQLQAANKKIAAYNATKNYDIAAYSTVCRQLSGIITELKEIYGVKHLDFRPEGFCNDDENDDDDDDNDEYYYGDDNDNDNNDNYCYRVEHEVYDDYMYSS